MSFVRPVLLQDGRLTVAPTAACTWEVRPLLNGTNKNMITSTVPATYSFSPAAGTTYYLVGLSIAFASTGTPDSTDFGNIAALGNGIDINIKSTGVLGTAMTIKDNFDLALTFSQYTTIGGAAGFLNDADAYTGSMNFSSPIVLEAVEGDFINVVIKNSTIGAGTDLRIYAHLYKEI